MIPASLRVIYQEHEALARVLKALCQLTEQGPGDRPQVFFDAMRAMLFYIDEFPERQHHPKESQWLFPRVAVRCAKAAGAIEQLNRDHEGGEAAVRELQHLLLAWELLGESRCPAFVDALARYKDFYLAHMRLEDAVVLPAALANLGADDWHAIDQAFATNDLLLTPGVPHDPTFDALYARIFRAMPDLAG